MALGRSRFDAHLARVTDPRPLVLPLTGPAAKSDHGHEQEQIEVHLIVKLRPNLLQYIVNGCVRWTVRSLVPITSVCELAPATESEGPQVLVATADGNVWLLTLPTEGSSAWSHTLLQDLATGSLVSSQGSQSQQDDMLEDQSMLTPSQEKTRQVTCAAKWLLCVPGIQSIYYVPSSSVTVCTSAITPTTLVFNITAAPTLLELDELEGDQSTAAICLHGHDQRYKVLLDWLFSGADLKSKVVVLQGDIDGCVRYCIVNARGKSLSGQQHQSGKIVDLDEPIHSVVPFQSRTLVTSTALDALLVVGAFGSVTCLAKSEDKSPSSHHIRRQQTVLGTSIDCIAYVDALGCFVYCSRGDVFAVRAQELTGPSSETRESSTASYASNMISIKLPFLTNMVRFAIDNISHSVSLVLASGAVSSVSIASFSETVRQFLPSVETGSNDESRSNSTEPHMKQILQRIAKISSQSTGLTERSQALDQHLHRLHSALMLLMHVQKHGVDSVMKLDLKLELSSSGIFSEQKSLRLICQIDGKLPDDTISFLSWSLYIHVRSRKQMMATYSFPVWLQDKQIREKSITLEESALALHEEGMLFVDCWLVFQSGYIDRQQPNSLIVESQQTSPRLLFSPSIPVVQGHTIPLASLSEPSREDIPSSHTAVRTRFQQANEISLPVYVNCDQTLLNGIQWWSSLLTHDAYGMLMQSRSPDVSAVEPSPPHSFVMRWKHIRESNFNSASIALMLQRVQLIGHSDGLDQCYREQNGKIWIGLKTFNGNLVALRFTLGESNIGMVTDDHSATRELEISVQCSDIADLSAIRAALMSSSAEDTIRNNGSEEAHGHFPSLSLELGSLLSPLLETETIVEELEMKIQNITSAHSSVCKEEVLGCLSRLALAETQTLDLYWKSRQILNKYYAS